ncbi:hypothetical protein KQI67_23125 [Bacillus albus]|uniref:hypothetical protein n=1 Tax=Bacillus albus TaxID=2026189 RepID=UPI001C10C16D|nr:hypothetical protein [Bacillus albus]MBU5219557.1 hypothetical protein [Bacillus albus]
MGNNSKEQDHIQENNSGSKQPSIPVQIFQTLGIWGEKFVELQSQIDNILNNVVSFINYSDWNDFQIIQKETAERLGGKGWTLPMLMVSEHIEETSKLKGLKRTNNWMLEYHSQKNIYDNMKENILNCTMYEDWKELLKQCFDSYEKENYLIAIPSLFIIVESITSQLISPRLEKYITTNKTKRKPPIRDQYTLVRPEIEEDKLNIIIYVSILMFLKSVFSKGDFDKKKVRPSIINRDWVLHGRDYPANWNKADALRLFIALHTIIELDFLIENLEKEEAEAESIK